MARLLIYFNPNKGIYYFRYRAILYDEVPLVTPQGHYLVSNFHIHNSTKYFSLRYRLANFFDNLSKKLK